MKELYFENVTGIGKLYLEYIFYEFENEPYYFYVQMQEKIYILVYVLIFAMNKNGLSWKLICLF